MKRNKIWLMMITVIGLVLASSSVNVMADAASASSANSTNTVYDISEWQGQITDAQAQQLKNEVPFVILRVQYGSAYADKTFQNNRDLMNKYGIPYGVYSFSQYENPEDAAYEAKVLYSRAPNASFYVNDYEDQTVTSGGTNDSTVAWLNALRPLVGNRKILLYSDANFMVKHSAYAVSSYDGYWLAAYQDNEPAREHVLWQFTSRFYSKALDKSLDANLLTSQSVNWFIGDTYDVNNPSPVPTITAPTTNQSNQASNNANQGQQKAQSGANDSKNSSAANTNNPIVPKKKTTKKKKTTAKKKKVVKKVVNYTIVNKKMMIKAGSGLEIYNHVPGDTKYSGKIGVNHHAKNYANKEVTINSLAKNVVTGNTYYRIYYKGRAMGWISTTGVQAKPSIQYSKYNLTKIVRLHPKVNFYSSVGGKQMTEYGQSYSNTPVVIKQRAKRLGDKHYYYKAYYNGKYLGWAYASMFK